MSEDMEQFIASQRGSMAYEYGSVVELVRQFLAGEIDRDTLAKRVAASEKAVADRRAVES